MGFVLEQVVVVTVPPLGTFNKALHQQARMAQVRPVKRHTQSPVTSWALSAMEAVDTVQPDVGHGGKGKLEKP
ncbi:MAG: hypothetical protein WDM87_04715 [Terracidiphilus sp.]